MGRLIARAGSRVLEAHRQSCRRCRRTTTEQPSTTGFCLYRAQADPGQGPCDHVSPTKVLSCPSTIHPARRCGWEQKDAWMLSVSATVARRVNGYGMLHMELCLYVWSRAKCLGFFHGEMCVSTQRYRSLQEHHSFFDVVASADKGTLSSTQHC